MIILSRLVLDSSKAGHFCAPFGPSRPQAFGFAVCVLGRAGWGYGTVTPQGSLMPLACTRGSLFNHRDAYGSQFGPAQGLLGRQAD